MLPGVAQQGVDGGVVVLRLVMEQDEPGASCVRGEVDRLARRRVAPPSAHLHELLAVHRVVYQGVRTCQELHQTLPPIRRYRIRAAAPQLVVREVRDLAAAPGRSQPVPQGRAGMPEPEG